MKDYEIDKQKVRELVLHTENSKRLYDSHLVPLAKNYGRKKAKGIFDKEKGLEGIKNNTYVWARADYKREYGEDIRLNPKERELFADELYDGIDERSNDYRDEFSKNTNNKSVIVVKKHSRKGSKGVRSHYRRTKRSDLV